MIKRILKWVWLFLAAVFILFLFYNFIGGAICNDIKASQIKKTYTAMELPGDTRLVEAASYVGNTSGTGNHTEIWAGMLVYSELSEDELCAYFDGYGVWSVPSDLTTQYPYAKDIIDFTALNGIESGEGYFVIDNYYDAFTQCDMRGH